MTKKNKGFGGQTSFDMLCAYSLYDKMQADFAKANAPAAPEKEIAPIRKPAMMTARKRK